MTQLENGLQLLKEELVNMFNLVQMQLGKAQEAMLRFDKNLAREVVLKENRVNAYELKIDRDCENIFALYCPVAVDLRFVLAVLKINSNLERIGDYAEGIARYVVASKTAFGEKILEGTQLLRMLDESLSMLADTRLAFEKEDTILARSIFQKDEVLDNINMEAAKAVGECIEADKVHTEQALFAFSVIQKLERVGDQAKNIAEEIIFYVEAKVLKHHTEG